MLVSTFAYLPILLGSKPNPEFQPDWLISLGASLIFKAVMDRDVYAAIAAAAMGYAYHRFYVAATKPLASPNARRPQEDEDWKQLCNALPHGIAIQAADTGRWTYCNPALCELLGAPVPDVAYSKMEALKEKLLAASPGAIRGKAYIENVGGGTFADPGSRADEEEQNIEIFAPVTYEDGGIKKLIDVSAKSIRWHERNALLYALKDVTEKQKIESLRMANLIKSRIMRSLSHELRTPINCILNSLDYCKRKLAGDEESLSNINIALTNTNILLNKYNDILVLSSPLSSLPRTSSRWRWGSSS